MVCLGRPSLMPRLQQPLPYFLVPGKGSDLQCGQWDSCFSSRECAQRDPILVTVLTCTLLIPSHSYRELGKVEMRWHSVVQSALNQKKLSVAILAKFYGPKHWQRLLWLIGDAGKRTLMEMETNGIFRRSLTSGE